MKEKIKAEFRYFGKETCSHTHFSSCDDTRADELFWAFTQWNYALTQFIVDNAPETADKEKICGVLQAMFADVCADIINGSDMVQSVKGESQ